jgi:hypothetical protein
MSNHLHPDPEPQDALNRRLTRALETPPSFTIPGNFAARTAATAATLPAQVGGVRLVPYTSLAIRSAFASLAVAMVALAAWARTAPHAGQILLLGTEIALALEFVALTTWLSLRPLPER